MLPSVQWCRENFMSGPHGPVWLSKSTVIGAPKKWVFRHANILPMLRPLHLWDSAFAFKTGERSLRSSQYPLLDQSELHVHSMFLFKVVPKLQNRAFQKSEVRCPIHQSSCEYISANQQGGFLDVFAVNTAPTDTFRCWWRVDRFRYDGEDGMIACPLCLKLEPWRISWMLSRGRGDDVSNNESI